MDTNGRSRRRVVLLCIGFGLLMISLISGCEEMTEMQKPEPAPPKPNSPPTVVGDGIPDQSLTSETTTLDVSDYFTDSDAGDSLSYTATSNMPDIVTAVPSTADSSMITITARGLGMAEITVTASDGTASVTDTFTVTVSAPDNPPTVVGDGIPDLSLDLATNPTTTLGVSDYFTDPDAGDSLRYMTAFSFQPDIATAAVSDIDPSMITITARAPGMAEVRVQVADSVGLNVSDQFTVTVTAPVCAGQRADTRDWSYGANEELDFTEYERDALRRLHAAGWNGNGVDVVIMDYFNADGSPSHGTGVANVVRRYAPNANFHYTGTTEDDFQLPPDLDLSAFHLLNRSFAVPSPPEVEDRLDVPQSRALRDHPTNRGGMEIYGAGNVAAPLPGGDPHRAVPVIKENRFVADLANPDHPGVESGYLHAKSAVLVVGAVDYRPGVSTDGGWVLSHHVDVNPNAEHSPRAGAARHAFIVAPDDNRAHTFAGTSFAAPRVTGALAILSQKCPYLTSEQLGYLLLRSARDLGEPGVDEVYGYGLMDVANAMARAVELMAAYDDFDSTIPPTANSR